MFADAAAERHADGAHADGLRAAWRCRRASSRGCWPRAALAANASERRAAGERRGATSPAEARRAAGLSRREDTERAFLALCIASPEQGAAALAGLDVDEHFASELLRRAARHLRDGNLREPMAEPPGQGRLEDDPELKGLLAELIVEAGREAPTRRCSRCSACSWSWPAWTARSTRRGGSRTATSASWRSAARRSSASSTAPTGRCSRRRGTGGVRCGGARPQAALALAEATQRGTRWRANIYS